MPCEMISYEGHIAQSAAEPTPSPHTSTFPSFAHIDPTEGENLAGHSRRGASCPREYGQCKLDSTGWRMRTRESQEGVERIRGEAGGG